MTIVFPKLSAPLVKDIRTGEGIAEWALGIGVTALTAVGDLDVVKGATFLTIIAGMKGIRRGLVKLVAVQSGAGIGAPIEPAVLSTISTDIPKVASAFDGPPAEVDPQTGDQPVPPAQA